MGKWLSELRQKNQKPYGEEPTKLAKGGFCGFCRCSDVGIPEKNEGEDLTNTEPEALPAHPGDWPPDQLEAYLERAAIIEYDARLPRPEAEHRAEELVREAHRRSQEQKL